jgi:hypothetical protein
MMPVLFVQSAEDHAALDGKAGSNTGLQPNVTAASSQHGAPPGASKPPKTAQVQKVIVVA